MPKPIQLDMFAVSTVVVPAILHTGDKPRLLDGCCAGGGAGKGYADAGFDVTGVDLYPQPAYPFPYHQADILEFLEERGSEFDVWHVSAPCQGYSFATPTKVRQDYRTDIIGGVKQLADEMGVPCIIENVREARHELDTMLTPTCDCYDFTECEHSMEYVRRWREPIMLCGEMFGLRVLRHRYFEIGGISIPQPEHPRHVGTVANGDYVTVAGHGADNAFGNSSIATWQTVMQMPWVNNAHTLAEAIPPAYTKFLGEHLLAWL